LKDGHSEDLEFIIKAAQHAQISSDIARHLNSAKAMRDTPQSTMRHMQTLEARLVAWQQSLDPIYKTRAPFNSLRLQGTQLFRMLFFHFSYLVSVITIHGSFCYPWDQPDLQSAKGSEIRVQMRKSTEAVGQASRQIILGLQRLETTFTLPLWYDDPPNFCEHVHFSFVESIFLWVIYLPFRYLDYRLPSLYA
jgi:hypothetical protein